MKNNNKDAEVYFWFRGNPFELPDETMLMAGFGEHWIPDERLQGAGLELTARLRTVEHTIGYMAAGKTFLMFGSVSKHWSRNLHEVLQFFPVQRTIVHRVPDPELEIANRISVKRRVQMARKAEAPHSTQQLPEVEFHVPRSYGSNL